MKDEQALLAAIWAEPHDDVPRLVYADWLEETGGETNTSRAAFIRVQCELAGMEDDEGPRRAELLEREAALRPMVSKGLKKAAPKSLASASFSRGFLSPRRLGLTGAKFLLLKEDAFDAAPLWDLSLSGLSRNFERVFASPLLLRVGELKIDLGKFDRDALAFLAGCPYLKNVRYLAFQGLTVPRADSMQKFFDSDGLPALRDLFFGTENLGPDLLRLFSECRAARQLTDLFLGARDIRPEHGPIFSSEAFPRLRGLRLGGSPLGDAGLRALVAGPAGAPVRELNLRSWQLSDEGAALLVNWPGAAHLRDLDLSYNPFGADGFRALARSPALGKLKSLKLREYDLRNFPDVRAELDARFGSAVQYDRY